MFKLEVVCFWWLKEIMFQPSFYSFIEYSRSTNDKTNIILYFSSYFIAFSMAHLKWMKCNPLTLEDEPRWQMVFTVSFSYFFSCVLHVVLCWGFQVLHMCRCVSGQKQVVHCDYKTLDPLSLLVTACVCLCWSLCAWERGRDVVKRNLSWSFCL